MSRKVIICAALAAVFLFATTGCVTTGESGGGWGQPETTQPPPSRKPAPPPTRTGNSRQEQAARNHLRSAYQFLAKGKPDHALKQLEKARQVMEGTFWFHYYMGGAYFYKGMYHQARDNWQIAFRSTRDYRLRSRLRTCQSFAVFRLEGQEKSSDMLRRAMDLDEDNGEARELYRDLTGGSRRSIGDDRTEPSTGSMRPPESGHQRKDDDYDRGTARKRGNFDNGDDNDDDHDEAESPYVKSKVKKPSKKENSQYGKTKKNGPRKIQDQEIFRKYFLIEMD